MQSVRHLPFESRLMKEWVERVDMSEIGFDELRIEVVFGEDVVSFLFVNFGVVRRPLHRDAVRFATVWGMEEYKLLVRSRILGVS